MVDDYPLGLPARLELHRTRAADARARGDRARQAFELAHACVYAAFTGAPSDECQRAEELAVAAGDRDAQALAVSRGAGVLVWALQFELARTEALRAISLSALRPDSYAFRGAFLVLGGLAIELGQYDAANLQLAYALALSDAAGDLELASFCHQSLARSLGFLGDLDAAQGHAERALTDARALHDINSEVFSYWVIGDIAERLGRIDDARTAYQAGFDGCAGLGGPIQRAIFLGRLAETELARGNAAEAQRLVDQASAEIAAGRLAPSWARVFDNIQAHIYAETGRDREAAEAYGRVRGYAGSGWAVSHSIVEQGRALRRLGDLAGARAAFEDGIASIEASRPHGPSEIARTSFAMNHSGVYRELVDLLWQIEGPAGAERALAVAEAGRARALLDAVAASGLEHSPRPRPTAELRARVPVGAVLVEYVSTETRLLAFAITRDAVREVALDGAGSAEALAARIAFVRQLIQEEGADRQALLAVGRRLHADLLEPLGVTGTPTLLVAADGPLLELPFDTLAVGDHFLAETTTVAAVPSASLLDGARAAGATEDPLIAIADPPPRPGLPLLPSSLEEAREVAARAFHATLLTGDAATEHRLRASGLAGAAVLHFATHAVVDDYVPLRSALVLAPGDGDDGFLRASDIYPLALKARLVVLSACGSGAGRGAPGEGLLSLERAFLYAGAGTVVATLWEVGDRSSLELMRTFYDELARGATTSAALASAKRALIARGGPPRTWAGFALSGVPDTRVVLRAPSRPIPWTALGIGVLGAIGLAAVLRGYLRSRRAQREG